MDEGNLYSVAGLVYDIVGALILALAIAVTHDAKLYAQAGIPIRMNPALFEALEVQRDDAQAGLVILVVGSTLQLVATENDD